MSRTAATDQFPPDLVETEIERHLQAVTGTGTGIGKEKRRKKGKKQPVIIATRKNLLATAHPVIVTRSVLQKNNESGNGRRRE